MSEQEFQLRSDLEQVTVIALTEADLIADRVAAGNLHGAYLLVENYRSLRTVMRRLRRALEVGAAG